MTHRIGPISFIFLIACVLRMKQYINTSLEEAQMYTNFTQKYSLHFQTFDTCTKRAREGKQYLRLAVKHEDSSVHHSTFFTSDPYKNYRLIATH